MRRSVESSPFRVWLLWTIGLVVPLVGYGAPITAKAVLVNGVLAGAVACALLPWLTRLTFHFLKRDEVMREAEGDT